MIIRTTDYDAIKKFTSASVGTMYFFDGGTYFAIYATTMAQDSAMECRLPGRPSTWSTDVGTFFPPTIVQLTAPLEMAG